MTALIRAASLAGYVPLAQSKGLDVAHALQRVGLSAHQLADPDALIPYTALLNLMEYSAEMAACPSFGLQLAQVQGIDILGAVAVLFRHAPTVGEALTLVSRYIFFHNPAVQLGVLPVPGNEALVDLQFALKLPNLPPCAQTMERSLALMAHGLHSLGQGDIRLHRVQFPHPRLGLPGDYQAAFGCECQFQTGVAAIRIAASDLQRSTQGHNPTLQHMAAQYLAAHFGASDQLFSDRVRSLVRRFLGEGPVSHADVARALSINPRTMQRRLKDEGQVFEAIVDDIRRQRLQELLAQPQALSLLQIALVLGYTEQASLTRSCQRWFGCAPSQLRRRLQQEATVPAARGGEPQ